MFKVMCINDNWVAAPGCEKAANPICGNTYTVVEAKAIGFIEVYVLVELGDEFAYKQSHFATLPDQDSDEIEAETKEVIVPCPAY